MRFTRFEEGSGYCGKCLRQVPVYRVTVKHVPHLVLTLCTVGLWLFIWIREVRKVHHWKCVDCGATVYKIMN